MQIVSAVTDSAGKFFLRAIERLEPAKPAPPVMRMASAIRHAGAFRLCLSGTTMIVAARKMFFEP